MFMNPDDYTWLLSPLMLGLLGLCIGSFLNVVIHRLPLMMERQWLADSAAQLSDAAELQKAAAWKSAEAEGLARSAQALGLQMEKLPHLGIATPRSRCPHCGHQLAWHENLPLLGWLRLGANAHPARRPFPSAIR